MNNWEPGFLHSSFPAPFLKKKYMWGCFQIHNEVHVIPCDKNSNIGIHIFSLDCYCNPRVLEDQSNVIVHEESVN